MALTTIPLRERQRQVGKDVILAVSLDLFTRRGYDKTTVQDIAEKSGVGVATIFRHFKSKAGILAALTLRDLEKVLTEAAAIAKDPPPEPGEAILKLLWTTLKILDAPCMAIRIRARFWRLLPTGQEEADAVVTYGDTQLKQSIETLLTFFQKKKLLAPRLSIPHAGAIIFQVFNHHYIDHALGQTSRSDLEKNLRKRIPMLFESWGQ